MATWLAAIVASRICSRLATDGLQPPLSASTGVALCPEDGETIEALLRAADRELYARKCHVADEHSLHTARCLSPIGLNGAKSSNIQ